MYISVNKKGEIKKVGVSADPTLKSLYLDDTVDDFPFNGWSEAKICCYKVRVVDGIIMMMTPYVDSRLLEHFDMVGNATESNRADIESAMDGLTETFETVGDNTSDIADCMQAITEIYEMIGE